MSDKHGNNFFFLRFLACALIWYGSSFQVMGLRDPLSTLLPFETYTSLGITLSLILSGYLVTASYTRHDELMPFLRNRALRIFPALAVVMAFSALLVGPMVSTLPLTTYLTQGDTWRYLRGILLYPLHYELPGVYRNHPQHSVNAVLWTLPHGVLCYVGIALLGLLGVLQARIMTLVFLFLAATLAYGAISGTKTSTSILGFHWAGLSTDVHFAYLFAGGGLIYLLRTHIPRHFGLFCTCLLVMALSSRLSELWGTLLWDTALLYGVIYIAYMRLPFINRFGHFGDFSYGMFLYAFPIQQLTFHLMQGEKTPFNAFLMMSFTSTLLCAIASWHLIEKPALEYKA